MQNVLLIDDEANNGWKEIIEKVLFNNEPIALATDLTQASELLATNKYDLIFLDLRFGQEDHNENNIEKFGGYLILNDNIRKSFNTKNFSTPVILFTASNKVWNVFEMLENGADSYYIKEHPDTSYDLEFSRRNFIRLKESVPSLIALGQRREEILLNARKIISLAQVKISDKNIMSRIEEKLMIGYATLFQKTLTYEKKKFLFNKEILAFVVFWSILEEISHDYYNRQDEVDPNWILRNGHIKIQFENDEGFLETKFENIKLENNPSIIIDNNSKAAQITLSNQIAGILRYQLGWTHNEILTYFLNKLNKYRNDIDFIHSSTFAIRNNSLKKNQDSAEAYIKCVQILDFYLNILK